MKRTLAFFAALICSWPATAQPAHSPELVRASRALSAIWRPIAPADMGTPAAVDAACAGAIEEIAAVEAALPPVITPESLAPVRALRGLLIVPTGDDPGVAYFFPDPSMTAFASGLGAIAVLSEAEGMIGVRDAAGHDIAVQLGRSGRQAVLRVRPPGSEILTFVGCASTWGLAEP
jgi:hypothetical protein